MEIVVEEFIKSEKLLQILIKLLNPQILFWKSQTNCKSKTCRQMQKNILQIRKNILPRVTCASNQPASEFCRIQNGGGACVGSYISKRFANDTGVCSLCMIRVSCYFELACRYDESLGACRLSRFYKLRKSHSKASPSTLLYCLFTDVISLWS